MVVVEASASGDCIWCFEAPQGRSLYSWAVRFSASRMGLGPSRMGLPWLAIHPRGKGVIGEPPQSGGVVDVCIDRREVPGKGVCVATRFIEEDRL